MDATADELIARLRRAPGDFEAFRLLGDHYRRLGDYASLANLLEGWAGRATDTPRAARALHEAALLVMDLGDLPRAEALLARALERDPTFDEANTQLVSLLEHRGDTTALLQHLSHRSALFARQGDTAALGAVEEQIGRTYEHRLGRPDRAVAHYRRAFEADPSLVAAIYAARGIYRAAGNPKAAATLFELEIRAEPSRERRVALLRELGHLRASELTDVPGGIDALSRAEREAPEDLSVLHELATLLLENAKQRGEGPASVQAQTKAADLFVRLARAVPADHAMAYAQSALDAAPAHDEALSLLEGLAAEHGREDLLPARWVGYLQRASAGPGADARRLELGRAYVDAGQLDDALVCLEPLVQAGDASAADLVAPIFRSQGRDAEANRALAVAVDGSPLEDRAPRLRELVAALRASGDEDEAYTRARELLSFELDDVDTLAFAEEVLRRRRDYGGLRDLLVAATRLPNAPLEVTKRRLREIANLTEDHLNDADGAVAAYTALLRLDPTDEIAGDRLGGLLERLERWDELVAHLEHASLGLVDAEAKAATLSRLAELHRDRRFDPISARDALRKLRQLRPNDPEARDTLCDLLIEMESWAEALPLVEERIESSSGDERLRLLELLGATLEDHLGDDDAAFAASTRLLDEDPMSLTALDRMERIDARSGNASRLLDTLAYRVDVLAPEARSPVLLRVAQVADENLGDLDRAADALQQALDLEPSSGTILDALCDVYDRGERYKDLVVLLRERARVEDRPSMRAEHYRRIARVLRDRVGNPDAASEAWEKVLEAGEDEEALRALLERAIDGEHDEERLELARRLAARLEGDERRDLQIQRARWFEAAGRLEEAVRVVREEVLASAPSHLPVLFDLARWEERRGDDAGLADALERQLVFLEDEGLRLPVATRLADLYEGSLADDARAIDALYAWIESEPTDTEPRGRLVAKLEAAERWPELLDALDGLASVEVDADAQRALVLRAAEVAATYVGDVNSAWARLAERAHDDAEAEVRLRALADAHERHTELAELLVRFAQTAPDVATQRRRWLEVATVLEGPVGDVTKALEAVLRAYALDLADEDLLGEVDRLAAASGAWVRLAQVYETLLRSVETTRAKKKLLVRHAKLLDQLGDDASGALDRALRACALAPDDEALLGYVEDLAPRARRAEELLVVYERRRSTASDDAARTDALLRAAQLCDVDLRDRNRAFDYLAQAVALSVRTPEIGPTVEKSVRELDDLSSGTAARARLVDLYRRLAEDAEHDPRGAVSLLLRAARLLEDELEAPDQALDCLVQASNDAPIPEVLDALEGLTSRTRRLDALDAQLAALIAEALDSQTAADLLRRRAHLLEERLGRLDEAADVYRQLLSVARDEATADRLLGCLRKAGRHQDLLVALDQELSRARAKERRVTLLKEVAEVWEKDLGNNWEAQDAWKKVLAAAGDDPVATNALRRLGASTRRLHPDDIAPDASARDSYEPAARQTSLDEPDELPSEPEPTDAVAPFDDETPALEDAMPLFTVEQERETREREPSATTQASFDAAVVPARHALPDDHPSPATPLDDDARLFADETPSAEHFVFLDEAVGSSREAPSENSQATPANANPGAADRGETALPSALQDDPFASRERTAPFGDAVFPEDIFTHVEADPSLDEDFPPPTPAFGRSLDDALPYAATVAATPDSLADDDVESVPIRDEPARTEHDGPSLRRAADLSEPSPRSDVSELRTGELLAFEDATSTELLDDDDLNDADVLEPLDDFEELEEAELVDGDEPLEEAPPPVRTSLPPPPPRRRD